jgi:phage terminase small subunit
VEEYVVDFNGKAAAVRAGYSKRSAAELAYQLLQKPEIAEAVKAATQKASEAAQMNAADWWREMSAIGTFDPGDVYDFTGTTLIMKSPNQIPERARRAIAGIRIKRKVRVEGEGDDAKEVIEEDIDIQFHSKIAANNQVGKALGILTDKVEHSGHIETVAMTEEERAEALANILKTPARKALQDGSDGDTQEHVAGSPSGDGPDPAKPAASN